MLVVSKPKNVCHYGSNVVYRRPVITCFGFQLRSWFSIPTRQVSKPQRSHLHQHETQEFSSSYSADGVFFKPGCQSYSVTTAASESHSSPQLSYIEERLPEFSQNNQPTHEIYLSGTLSETLRSVAGAHSK
jgi:hypothetical protein